MHEKVVERAHSSIRRGALLSEVSNEAPQSFRAPTPPSSTAVRRLRAHAKELVASFQPRYGPPHGSMVTPIEACQRVAGGAKKARRVVLSGMLTTILAHLVRIARALRAPSMC